MERRQAAAEEAEEEQGSEHSSRELSAHHRSGSSEAPLRQHIVCAKSIGREHIVCADALTSQAARNARNASLRCDTGQES